MGDDVEFSVRAIDEYSKTLNDAENKVGGLDDSLANAGQSAQVSSLSFTELSSALGLVQKGVEYADQAFQATVGTFQAYAEQVRDLKNVSGESAENTSRFIQVLDDYQISAEDAMTATKALKTQGFAPNLETLADLSDKYLALNTVEDKNAFVLKNLGKAGLEWTNVLKQGSTAIREQSAAVSGALILDEQMLARAEKLRLAQDNLNDTWEATKIEIGEKAVPLITTALDHFNKKTQESSLAQAIFTTGFDDIIQVIRDTVDGTDDATASTNALADAQNNAEPTATELAAAEKLAAEQARAVSDANQTLIDVIGRAQAADDEWSKVINDNATKRADLYREYADLKRQGYSEESEKIQGVLGKLDELAQKDQEMTDAREKQTVQFEADMLRQELARDGWTDGEEKAFEKQMIAWGLWSQEAVDEANSVIAKAHETAAAIDAIPTDKVINITSYYKDIYGGAASDADRRASTPHALGGSFIIPAQYGIEGFKMGNGDTASAGERLSLTPAGQSSGNSELISAIRSNRIDEARLAREIVSAMARAG